MSTDRGRVRITFFEALIVLAIAVALQALVAYARQAHGADAAVSAPAATAESAVRNVRSCRVAVCGYGTAFFLGEVSPRHQVFLTAAHVVAAPVKVEVGIGGQWRQARILKADARLDVAVLGVVHDGPVGDPLLLAESNASSGLAIRWLGCPDAGPVREGKGTATGPATFAPHPIGGDSGGPVLDAAKGEVVGLTVTRGGGLANANVGGMVAVSDLRRIVVEACGGLPPAQDRIRPVPDPGYAVPQPTFPPPAINPGAFVVPAPQAPAAPAKPAPPSGPAGPDPPGPDRSPDVAGLAGAVAQAVVPKLVPALLPFLPEGIAALLVPAAVASGPVGLGILAGGALLRMWRRRRAGRGPPAAPGGPACADTFRRLTVPDTGPVPVEPQDQGLHEQLIAERDQLLGMVKSLRQQARTEFQKVAGRSLEDEAWRNAMSAAAKKFVNDTGRLAVVQTIQSLFEQYRSGLSNPQGTDDAPPSRPES